MIIKPKKKLSLITIKLNNNGRGRVRTISQSRRWCKNYKASRLSTNLLLDFLTLIRLKNLLRELRAFKLSKSIQNINLCMTSETEYKTEK